MWGSLVGRSKPGEERGAAIGLIDKGSGSMTSGASGPFFSRIIRIGLLKKDSEDFSGAVCSAGSCVVKTVDGEGAGCAGVSSMTDGVSAG